MDEHKEFKTKTGETIIIQASNDFIQYKYFTRENIKYVVYRTHNKNESNETLDDYTVTCKFQHKSHKESTFLSYYDHIELEKLGIHYLE